MCVVWIIAVLFYLVGAKLFFDHKPLKRLYCWFAVLCGYTAVHLVSLEAGAFLRMVMLCSVLMAGMKWIVYSEWRRSGGQVIPLGSWLCFACCWFGMDPKPWVTSRRKLSVRADWAWGSFCGLVGVALVYVMSDVVALVPLFIAMSMGFHFGALRLLTAFWKSVGVPVRALFRNPLRMRGFADFWGKRWNLAYSQMMARCVKRPLNRFLDQRAGTFAVFVISGLLHELAITVPVRGGYGLPTLFFMMQGLFTCYEGKPSKWMGVLCGLSLIWGLPVLFPERFVMEVILPARDFVTVLIEK
ncbi:MBOAT family protein [Rubritalea sp.]|uniref:MBOAT family protein n=1 Tax=Rubritalea sp. TaxID=2109375 RepID=UPI003EFB0E35